MKILIIFHGLAFVLGRQEGHLLPIHKPYSQILRIHGGNIDDVVPSQPSDTTTDLASTTAEALSSSSATTSSPLHRSPRFLGFTLSDLKSSAATRGAQVGANLKNQLDLIRKKQASLSMLPRMPDEWKGRSSEAMKQVVVPAAAAAMELLYRNGDVRFLGVYALALVGSCSGFHLFLYFITVGYALGVMLPVCVALYIYSKQPVENLTAVHSGLTILWGIRSAAFFLYREYVNWPLLHDKVVEVNQMARLGSKLFCWIVYSFCYAAMATPCLSRLKSGAGWARFGKVALGLQATGLVLETVADYQKSTFKALTGNRNQWCNVGLFQYSTFPNYLGEILFWYGTFLAGMASFKSISDWTLAMFGVFFVTIVIRGAITSLGAKQIRKYGSNPDFIEFQRTHGLLGPLPFQTRTKQVTATTAPSEEPQVGV